MSEMHCKMYFGIIFVRMYTYKHLLSVIPSSVISLSVCYKVFDTRRQASVMLAWSTVVLYWPRLF